VIARYADRLLATVPPVRVAKRIGERGRYVSVLPRCGVQRRIAAPD